MRQPEEQVPRIWQEQEEAFETTHTYHALALPLSIHGRRLCRGSVVARACPVAIATDRLPRGHRPERGEGTRVTTAVLALNDPRRPGLWGTAMEQSEQARQLLESHIRTGCPL